MNLEWFGFWIFMAVFIFCEVKMYLAGHDTFFFEHKTDAEKKLQQKEIEKRERI